MSTTQANDFPKKTTIKCCVRKDGKQKNEKPKAVPKPQPLPKPVVCKPIEQPPKQPTTPDTPPCEQPSFYRSGAEQKAYLQRDVVPIVMEGMLGLAREQPRDPISYLERFWLNQEQTCDIPLPKNLL